MSARGLFIKGFTKCEVQRIQAMAKQLLFEGKTVMSWNDGGTSVTKQLAMPVSDVLEECAYALNYFDRAEGGGNGSTGALSHVSHRLPM